MDPIHLGHIHPLVITGEIVCNILENQGQLKHAGRGI
jgi:hypothetical protein